jgi:tetratricopeptide (TPR) repeat protein
LFGFAVQCLAQSGEIINKKEQRRVLEEGEYFYEEGNYLKALEHFKKLEAVDPNDLYYKLVIGICYSYKVDEKQKSIEYLENVQQLNPEFNEVKLYLGRAYAVNQRFDDAIAMLEEYLMDEDVEDESAALARRWIQNAENGRELVADSIDVKIKNMGEVVNSKDAEYVPLITPDESQLIFTYKGEKSLGPPDKKGEYFEDVYISFKSPDDWMYDEDVWLEPKGIETINTENDDACIAISIDGQKLFLYSYEKVNGGDLYVSELEGTVWSEPIPLGDGINTKYWEGSLAISSDERELYFASDRPGGFGGRDLYKAEKQEDGTWGNIQNLGPDINTPYNDDSPFLQIDKQTLFYSSEGHNSMGGYDIFFSKMEDGKWGKPTNLGYPVNTVEDDRYFVINASGKKGFYSSAGANSLGDQDLYYVELDPVKLGIQSVAALIVGTVFIDDVPGAARLTIENLTTNTTGGEFESNSESGNYGLALAPGFAYAINYEVENYETHTDQIDLTDLNDYIEVSNNVYIYSKQYAEENNIEPKPSILQALADSALTQVDKEEELALTPPPVEDETALPDVPAVAVLPEVPAATKEGEVKSFSSEGEGETPTVAVTETPEAAVAKTQTDEAAASETPVAAVVKEDEDEAAVAAIEKEAAKGDEPCDDEFVDLSAFVGKDLNDVAVYNSFLNVVGNYCADQLVFRVQIGAYRFPENFKYDKLKKFGEASITDYPDGITRFTMGEFITLKEADDLRQQIRATGQDDAWVVPFFDGKRMFMEDLIKVNFYNRSIN